MQVHMSAYGPKRTFVAAQHESAFDSKRKLVRPETDPPEHRRRLLPFRVRASGATMRRRDFLAVFSSALVAAPLAAREQHRKSRFGWGYFAPASNADLLAALRKGLRDLGYVEGRNLLIDFRYLGRSKTDDEIASELVRLKPDVIVLVGTPTALAAKRQTATIPIIMAPPPIRCARALWRA